MKSITGKTDQLLALDDMIIIYVKYLEQKEKNNQYIQGGVQYLVLYLKIHLLKLLLDHRLPEITNTSPVIKLPMRFFLKN